MSLLIFHPYLSIVPEKKPEIATRNLIEVAHWESAFTFRFSPIGFLLINVFLCCLLSTSKQSEAKAGSQRKVDQLHSSSSERH